MDLIVLSSPEAIEKEAQIVNALFEEGLSVFHCRKPQWSADQVVELIQGIALPYRSQITIHQHHELAKELGLQRLHYTEANRKAVIQTELSLRRQKGITLSTSLHQLSDYNTTAQQFDYVFYGPVFNSISKQGYTAVVSDDFRLPSRQSTQAKRIGLGGIDETNIHQAVAYGFEGVAVLGTLWTQPQKAVQRFRSLKRITDTY
ncbi:thiamine phosphate synthase [Cytophagaceae bacterium YF14B1]|uniref:Thiamine phosphate synthase n=1 Tax=Xanthocytophaga flava TaxID=3048013 RepID=A0AAE3R163_9BACT|nr:thiamine phosphate synthase [Xanthocytophaga flavus]MDJ1486203.1 thiamine phosphate synthase [Xanthocytophaga flavus]